MGLKEEISEWRQPDGLITPKSERPGTETQDTTGDGIKHFSQYCALLVRRGDARESDLNDFERVIRACYVRQGLPNRSPTKTQEQISKDALIGASYAGWKMRSRIAWEILDRGNAMRWGPLKWFYPNLFPERFEKDGRVPLKMLFTKAFWSSWMGKNPEVITHLQWCGLPAGFRPHWLRVLYQAFYFIVVTVSLDHLNSVNFMMADAARDRSRVLDFAICFWSVRLHVKYRGGIKECLSRELEPSHPIVTYWYEVD